jgi:hypothetical protein
MSKAKETWKKRVASWRASGETVEQYSIRRGWSVGTLRWWSSRLGREATPPVVRVAQLVRSPVLTAQPTPAGTVIVELLDARVRVTIEPGADSEIAGRIVEPLASRVER